MGASITTNFEEITAVLLFVIGILNLLMQPNLVKKIIGLEIMDSAIYLFLAAKGYVEGRTAPIVVDGILDAEHYINPIPAGLVLTGIVVSVSVSALMMALTICLYREFHTLNLDEIMMKLRRDESIATSDLVEDQMLRSLHRRKAADGHGKGEDQ